MSAWTIKDVFEESKSALEDMIEPLSTDAKNAILYLGDAIAESLSQGYDAAAKSTEEVVFPVKAERARQEAMLERMRRRSPTPTKWEQEVVLDESYDDLVALLERMRLRSPTPTRWEREVVFDKPYDEMMATEAVVPNEPCHAEDTTRSEVKEADDAEEGTKKPGKKLKTLPCFWRNKSPQQQPRKFWL